MNPSGNTILITGGGSGIGFALTERFLALGNTVIICGRRESKLREAQAKHSKLRCLAYDLSKAEDRVALFQRAVKEFPHLNVLVNNAGIQRRFTFGSQDWDHTEIAINLEAPMHLTELFIPHLRKQQHPVIINVTSGLAFAPMAMMPVYCATKAAMHSYTLSLRHLISPIEVIEIIPPAVNTDLGGTGLHTTDMPLDEFADAVMQGISHGDVEITFGFSQEASRANREELNAMFKRMNER